MTQISFSSPGGSDLWSLGLTRLQFSMDLINSTGCTPACLLPLSNYYNILQLQVAWSSQEAPSMGDSPQNLRCSAGQLLNLSAFSFDDRKGVQDLGCRVSISRPAGDSSTAPAFQFRHRRISARPPRFFMSVIDWALQKFRRQLPPLGSLP
jgi:hypothetical protein